MVEMRELNDDEKKFITRRISSIKEDIEYNEYLVEHADLMLEKGLKQNYRSYVKEYKKKRRDAENMAKQSAEVILELERQLSEGVEIKEVAEEATEGEE